jgi:NTP pyrophosphatase (non-canonical NTP hydrolase)
MDWNTYKKEAMKFCNPLEGFSSNSSEAKTILALMGIAGEAGELVDLYKKQFFHGHPNDMSKVKKELGDIMWYVNLFCEANKIDIEEVLDMNVAKNQKRYGDRFTNEASINRKDSE